MTTSNNTKSVFVSTPIDTESLFRNEPLRESEVGEVAPVREGTVAGLSVRVYKDLYASIGIFEKGKKAFPKSVNYYGQIIGLLNALEDMIVGKGTWEHGYHSSYDADDLQFVGDTIKDFAYVKFSDLVNNKPRAKWLKAQGIVDDGKHQDRWVSLKAENGRLSFGYQVHPRKPKQYLAHLKQVFSQEAHDIALERDGTERRIVSEMSDITPLDWKANDKAWAQQNRHDGFAMLINALDGKQYIRINPILTERSNGKGLSVQDQAAYILDRYTQLFESADVIEVGRKERKASAQAQEEIRGTKHVIANRELYPDYKLSGDVVEEVEVGTVTIVRDGDVVSAPADELISKSGSAVRLQNCYADGTAPIMATFVVWSQADLLAALNRAANRDMFVKVAGQ